MMIFVNGRVERKSHFVRKYVDITLIFVLYLKDEANLASHEKEYHMPKKTLSQKKATDAKVSSSSLYSLSHIQQTRTPLTSSPRAVSQPELRRDLYKTFILGILFIGIEFVLFIYSNKFGW